MVRDAVLKRGQVLISVLTAFDVINSGIEDKKKYLVSGQSIRGAHAKRRKSLSIGVLESADTSVRT